MRLPDGEGLRVVEHINQKGLDVPVAVITAYGSAENAVAALKAGAFDYLAKPVALEQLRALVKQALKVPEKPQPATRVPAARRVAGDAAGARADRAPREEPGAGVHQRRIGQRQGARRADDPPATGPRGEQPFIAVNCGAIPENLMESEFFGYRKGAFTGAEADRDGFFQAANGGTLFLDEVADLPLAMQVKLLRAIQEKKVRKVGATQEEPVDVRIISATHKKLGALVEAGEFRQDLYYRLHVIELRDADPARDARGHSADRQRDPGQARRAAARRDSSPRRSPRSSAIRSPATCASSRTSSSAGCRWPPTRSNITAEDLHLTPVADESDARDAARREVAAAGLPRPRRARGDQRGAREDALQPHRRGEAARHHVSRDALPDGAAGDQVTAVPVAHEATTHFAESATLFAVRMGTDEPQSACDNVAHWVLLARPVVHGSFDYRPGTCPGGTHPPGVRVLARRNWSPYARMRFRLDRRGPRRVGAGVRPGAASADVASCSSAP